MSRYSGGCHRRRCHHDKEEVRTCALAGAVFGAGAVARWRLEQRRLDLWDREWNAVGPRWGHKTG
ncbi:hypothetical protein ACWGJB_03675 [Streptomyces sp. NPDC054813]